MRRDRKARCHSCWVWDAAEEARGGPSPRHADPEGGSPPTLTCPFSSPSEGGIRPRCLGHEKVSERRGCRVLGQSRGTQRRLPRKIDGDLNWMTPAAFVAGLDDTATGAVPAASLGVSPVGAAPSLRHTKRIGPQPSPKPGTATGEGREQVTSSRNSPLASFSPSNWIHPCRSGGLAVHSNGQPASRRSPPRPWLPSSRGPP